VKKKIFNGLFIALCVAMLSVQAFAVEEASTNSIYAADAKQIAASVESTILNDFGIAIDSDTVMPVYAASLYDFAKTGILSIKPSNFEGGQIYVSDTLNNHGNFAGTVVFTIDGEAPAVHMYAPETNKSYSVDFRLNSNRINTLMEKQNVATEDTESKFVFVDGLGYVYYINNGNEEVLVAAGLKGTNGNIFNEENGGIVVVDDDFKAKAAAELAEYEERLEYLASLAPGENPITGGSTPAFVVDNTPYLNNANQNGTYFFSVFVFVILGAGLVVVHKRKDNN